MYTLRNLQEMVIEMTSQLNHVRQTKHENRQKMETKDTCFCEEKNFKKKKTLWPLFMDEVQLPQG